jgi:MraZ protein
MQFMSEAELLEMDSQGRVLLQKKVQEMIGAQQDLLFVGMLDRFAIWAPDTFEHKQMSQKDLAERIRARMIKK